MKISAKNISLRPFELNDFEETIKWRNDTSLRFMAQFHPYPVSKEVERVWCEKIVKDKDSTNVYFAIEENETEKLIGYFQLKNINWIHRTCWLGIIIGSEVERGKGYGKESLELGIDYAFNSLNLRKISLEVLSDNIAAIALYKKLGFEEEGTLKQHFFFNGLYFDVKVMGIFKPH